MPRFCSNRQAIDFINNQKGWIEKQLRAIPERRVFANGDKIVLNGEELEIKHCPDLRCGVVIDDGFLKVSGEADFLSRRVRDFIKKQAKKYLYDLSIKKAALIGCKVKRVVIKDTSSRWGSCSSLGNINYSWRIMLAPPEVVDYLAAHEVAHLRHQDHSAKFWECVDSLTDHAEYARNWLSKNGSKLNEYV